jgi:hypothetical protein
MKEDGKFVQAVFGGSFNFSLELNMNVVLQPGNYVFMIDPIWNA